MPAYCTPRLLFSPDPLSVTASVNYYDVTTYLINAAWQSGTDRDLDEPEAGQATFVLKNTHRDWEPEYSGGRFYPNIVPMRRFIWSIIADGVEYFQGTWYATSYQVGWQPGTTYATVTVTCTDGIGLLAQAAQLSLDPPDAESYGDVVAFDDPWGHWPLDETSGKKMGAASGPEGTYRGNTILGVSSPVLGDAGLGVLFGGDGGGAAGSEGHGRVALADPGVWHDTGEVSGDAVIEVVGGATGVRTVIGGPFDTGAIDYSFRLAFLDDGRLFAWVYTGSNGFAEAMSSVGAISAGRHHVAFTYDGGQLVLYLDGVAVATEQKDGGVVNPDANTFLYIGGNADTADGNTITMAHAAVYDYALSADRVAAHAAAALSRGYDIETAGGRIAELATHPLWSTAGIPTSQVNVTPRMMTGQGTFDEIVATVNAETPNGLFYFNASGDPAYEPFEYDTTVQATFGDASGEIQYDAIDPRYDNQVFNQSTVSRNGGLAQTAQDLTSIGQYGTRNQDENGLILAGDSDAALIAQAIVDGYANPRRRVESLDLNGADPRARKQILQREIGDVIRVKRRGDGGTLGVDVLTRILGKQKTLDVNRDLRCTWSLSRGLNAQTTSWLLGQSGYGELGQTTVLA